VIATVKENEAGELYIEFSERLMKSMGWTEGTTLVWTVESDKITLREETGEDFGEYLNKNY
jgi:hypothetical protein